MSSKVQSVEVLRIKSNDSEYLPDLVVVEEPLEIRVGYGAEDAREQISLSVTMRTPGNDEELCLGFLFAEGVINSYQDVSSVKPCHDLGKKEEIGNVMRVELQPSIDFDPGKFTRNFFTHSSCGVCGKASIDAIKSNAKTPVDIGLQFSADVLKTLHSKLLATQEVFKHTGGIHACGLFDPRGEIILHKEDVGRHNALDKLVGERILADELPIKSYGLILSGRISFELVQKAVRAGIVVIVGVGAPSSLAVDLAKEFKITLIGFLKEDGYNIYESNHRILNT
ncbi:MAG: formate dehydrogenase accessory sulfurtransferase FdhD [Cytophagales bacterium]|nr:formate dehydrogenase accessory sulfurtransferase FdhD [Cytophagales bacterium]